jgi:hypothetical protein
MYSAIKNMISYAYFSYPLLSGRDLIAFVMNKKAELIQLEK